MGREGELTREFFVLLSVMEYGGGEGMTRANLTVVDLTVVDLTVMRRCSRRRLEIVGRDGRLIHEFSVLLTAMESGGGEDMTR